MAAGDTVVACNCYSFNYRFADEETIKYGKRRYQSVVWSMLN